MDRELPIIQKTYDLIKWYVPLLNRLPKDHKYGLGQRMVDHLYDLLETLLTARYQKDKLALLIPLNTKLDILRYQTRILMDFRLMDSDRFEYASRLINQVGLELGGWIKQQRQKAGS